MREETILDQMGQTPLLEIKRLNPFYPGVRILAKGEYLNPGGSIKDRMVSFALRRAEERGFLKPGMTLVEPTTGNTGTSLALIGSLKGYRIVVVVPKSTSGGKLEMMREFGAEVVYVDNGPTMAAVLDKAKGLAAKNNWWMLNQFENPDNVLGIGRTLGEELIRETGGRGDYFVAGVGTGGTLMGVGRKLKAKNSKLKLVAVEPAESAVLSGEKPDFHQIEGIGEGFVPPLVDREMIDEVVKVESLAAKEMARQLAKKEGLLVGISAGANLLAALEIGLRVKKGTILTVLPDRGERYL